MEVRPIDANALRLNIEIWIQEYTNGTVGNLSLDDVLDYIDTAPTIEVKDNGQHTLASSKRTATRADAAFVACD